MYENYEKLFNEWNNIGENVKILGGIVQNPVPTEDYDLDLWCSLANEIQIKIIQLVKRTKSEIENCNYEKFETIRKEKLQETQNKLDEFKNKLDSLKKRIK